MPRILIVTGEASGDLHGANLAGALRTLRPDVELVGVGGDRMRAAGVALLPGILRADVMGMYLAWAHLRAGLHNLFTLARYLWRTSLDAVVFIDNPGINLRLARIAKWAGHRVIYYVTPQIWAWASFRMRLIRRRVDHAVVILPFEEELYRRAGVRCTFVGHPLLDAVAPSYDQAELRKRFALEGDGPVVGLLPGSREREVHSLFPVMLRAAEQLAETHREIQFVTARATSVREDIFEELLAGTKVKVRLVPDQPSEVMAACDVLLVASGTATLQAAIIGTPMVIVYRTSWLNYWLARWLINIKWIGLANIVAGRSIVTELIQQDATPERLSAEVSRLLTDEPAAREMRAALRKVRDALGSPGASKRAASAVLAECCP